MIRVNRDISLRPYNTFGLDSTASLMAECDDAGDLFRWLGETGIDPSDCLFLGSGSNILFRSGRIDNIIRPVNQAIERLDETAGSVLVRCGAGRIWDELVEWAVLQDLGGLENLSRIPGTVGAAPVQNIGAYGAELSSVLESVRVLDLKERKALNLSVTECRLGYRDSLFKNPEYRHWLIWEVFFRLEKDPIPNLTYKPLIQEFNGKPRPGIGQVREAVTRIRASKLPDPATTGNAGSFFRNPVVSGCHAGLLKADYPGMPSYYHEPGSVKIPAGWLIEQCGWKGYREGDAGVYPEQALVLVNYGSAVAADILGIAERITASVKEKFGIRLEPEVRIV